jgi:hypothetical protein
LLPNLPEAPDMKLIKEKKIYFEFINIGAIKNIITFKFERKVFELQIDPS